MKNGKTTNGQPMNDPDDEVFNPIQTTETELPDTSNFNELHYNEPPLSKKVTAFWKMQNGSIGYGVGANYGDQFLNEQSKTIKNRYVRLTQIVAWADAIYLPDAELEHNIALLEANN